MLGLAGCSRTVDDVERWESKNKVEKLKGALTDPKMEVRLSAAEALGRIKSESAVDDLANRINDEEAEVVLAALDALIMIGGHSVSTPLVAALNLDIEEARLKAAAALGALKARGAIPSLADMLDDPSQTVQLAAIEALGEIGSQAGSVYLIEKLEADTSAQDVQIACIQAMIHTGGADAVNSLLRLLPSTDMTLSQAAREALNTIGTAANPHALNALRNADETIRAGALNLLNERQIVPSEGEDLIWYFLANASFKRDEQTWEQTLSSLTEQGESALSTLVDAACHPDPVIREIACQTLEHIGDPALAPVMARVNKEANPQARIWFEDRSTWRGAPSKYLDLFGAVSALNPGFPQRMNSTEMLTSSVTTGERAYIPMLINLLGSAEHREQTEVQLKACGIKAVLPLMAALHDPDEGVVERAAALLVELSDPRAMEPLIQALRARLEAGEQLSNSPIYTALIKLDESEAEPLLLKIRPNTERAKQVFSRHYPEAKASSAMTTDSYRDNEAPITITIGYTKAGRYRSLDMTFESDPDGNWQPSKDLPEELP